MKHDDTIEKPIITMPDTVWVLPITVSEIIKVGIVGLGVGAMVWAFEVILQYYVLKPSLCHDGAAACGDAANYAMLIGSILGTAIGLAALVKLQTYRPLLIVILATAAMWGIVITLASLPWALLAVIVSALYALAYVVFAWTARIYNLWLAAVVMIVMLVIIRLALNG